MDIGYSGSQGGYGAGGYGYNTQGGYGNQSQGMRYENV